MPTRQQGQSQNQSQNQSQGQSQGQNLGLPQGDGDSNSNSNSNANSTSGRRPRTGSNNANAANSPRPRSTFSANSSSIHGGYPPQPSGLDETDGDDTDDNGYGYDNGYSNGNGTDSDADPGNMRRRIRNNNGSRQLMQDGGGGGGDDDGIARADQDGFDGNMGDDAGADAGILSEQEGGDEEAPTVRDMQEAINIRHPFGLKIWKPALYPKSRSIDAQTYDAVHSVPGAVPSRFLYLSPGNLAWTLIFGWWIALLYLAVTLVLIVPLWLVGLVGYGICWTFGYRSSGPSTCASYPLALFPRLFIELCRLKDYAKLMINLSAYMFWPFGKFIAKHKGYHMIFQQAASDSPSTPVPNGAAHGGAAHIGIDVPADSQNTTAASAATAQMHSVSRSPTVTSRYYTEEGQDPSEVADLLTEQSLGTTRLQQYAWSEWVPHWYRRTWNAGLSGMIFYLIALLLLTPVHLTVSSICFFFIIPVPMSKLNYVLIRHVLRHPLQLSSNSASDYLATQDAGPSSATDAEASGEDDSALRANTAANAAAAQASPSMQGVAGAASGAASEAPVAPASGVTPRQRPRPQVRPKSVFVWRPESVVESDQPRGPQPGGTHAPLATSAHHSAAGPSSASATHATAHGHAAGLSSEGHRSTQRFIVHASANAPVPASSSAHAILSAFGPGTLIDSEYEIVLCTYHAMGLAYYKYTVDGVNIIFINLLSMIAFTFFDFYVLGPSNGYQGIASYSAIFGFALLSVIPLAYFIGMAVSSITAHTGSVALGSVINATFGSIIEIILYAFALMNGKDKLVEGSIIGSFLAGLLALPGVSMLSGGLKRKEQRFNAKSAGVTSTMLVVAVIGVFTPTLFQGIYGSVEIRCADCRPGSRSTGFHAALTEMAKNDADCKQCTIVSTPPSRDVVYKTATRPLVFICATVLLLTYAVGLWFSLRTHASKIYPKKKPKNSRRQAFADGIASLLGRRNSSTALASPRPFSLGPAQLPLDGRRNESSSGISNANVPGSETSQSVTPSRVRRRLQTRGVTASNIRPFSIAAFSDLFHPSSTSPAVANSPRLRPGEGGAAAQQLPLPIMDDAASSGSDSDDEEGEGGHDHPGWGIFKAVVILLGCTVLYSIIAEVLIASIDFVLEGFPIDEKTLGLTLFALVPTVTEFYNAIAFALNGNIVLSLEIGSAYAIQVALLQIPALVAFSAIWRQYGEPGHASGGHSLPFGSVVQKFVVESSDASSPLSTAFTSPTTVAARPVPFEQMGRLIATIVRFFVGLVPGGAGFDAVDKNAPLGVATFIRAADSATSSGHGDGGSGKPSEGFTLVFPNWDFYSVMFSVFLLTYLYIEGKSNYFKGAILLLSYTVLMTVFFYVPAGAEYLIYNSGAGSS